MIEKYFNYVELINITIGTNAKQYYDDDTK